MFLKAPSYNSEATKILWVPPPDVCDRERSPNPPSDLSIFGASSLRYRQSALRVVKAGNNRANMQVTDHRDAIKQIPSSLGCPKLLKIPCLLPKCKYCLEEENKLTQLLIK